MELMQNSTCLNVLDISYVDAFGGELSRPHRWAPPPEGVRAVQ